jgi:sensor c-di-GMP phosphodiesterase-like protein
VDALKIDRMFTQAIGTDTVGSAIVDQICKMAALLELEVIVEGIETEAQVDYLLERYPDIVGQGWFFGRAVPPDEVGVETGKRAAVGPMHRPVEGRA